MQRRCKAPLTPSTFASGSDKPVISPAPASARHCPSCGAAVLQDKGKQHKVEVVSEV